MDQNNIIESGGFFFIRNFDSGNLGHVERVATERIAPIINPKTNAHELPDYEFNLWTRPDCAGTEFENANRTWFYFGIQASEPNVLVRLNILNLNKQGKMYNQGMAPVTRTLPGKPHWERIKDRPIHVTDDTSFTLSFKYKTPENTKATTFFAFTYPFSYAELQIALNTIDMRLLPLPPAQCDDDIYYCRECLVYSLEGRRVDLLTISSHHGITTEREERLKNLFPEKQERPFKFQNKKVIFMSARVHPGETPSSFVFNGFLNVLLSRGDPAAVALRRLYVFKMVPFLNPDGVARGHYRTDTRGVNLNRVYLSPSLALHPTVYAARALIRYYHFGCEKFDDCDESLTNVGASECPQKPPEPRQRSTSPGLRARPAGGGGGSSLSVRAGVSSSGEEFVLADQVLDMKIDESSEKLSKIRPNTAPEAVSDRVSLNDSMLSSCLGSGVHVTDSSDLRLQGLNPLRSLRDTLKDSISLLMDSGIGSDAPPSPQARGSVRLSWCRGCRAAARRAELAQPGFSAAAAPSYTASARESTFTDIQQYREHQQLTTGLIAKAQASERDARPAPGDVYFCTNCFKRFVLDADDDLSLECPPAGEGDSDPTPRPDAAPQPAPQPAPHPAPHPAPGVAPGASRGKPKEPDRPKPAAKPRRAKPPPGAAAAAAAAAAQPPREPDSGLYLYIDLHGHASKKGIFMYGNHFEDADSSAECMLLPRVMSLNSLHFHFSSCNFTERNMYLKDRRDGMSREGSGRVAVLKATGLVRSYTLECNYNTGRLVNALPPAARDPAPAAPAAAPSAAPPKYTPRLYEDVGRSLAASILDLTGHHPNSRIPNSEHRTVPAIREWLKAHVRTLRPPAGAMTRLRAKPSPPRAPHRPKLPEERKENAYAPAEPPLAPHPAPRPRRYHLDNELKPKNILAKRRNILAIRKPNSKTQLGAGKAKRRPAEGAAARPAAAASSEEYLADWEQVAGGTALGAGSQDALAAKRRAFPAPAAPARLKKIRLKSAV